MDILIKSNKIKIIVDLFIFLWILVSLARLLSYYYQFLSNDIKLFALSDSSKRQQFYGDMYPVFQLIGKSSRINTLYLLSKDGKQYFYGRYAMYPKKIYWVESLKELQESVKTNQINYLLMYHPTDFKNKQLQAYLKSHFVNYQNIYYHNSLSSVIYKKL